MDKQGFQTMLEGRKVPAEKTGSALALAERFEQFAAQQGDSRCRFAIHLPETVTVP